MKNMFKITYNIFKNLIFLTLGAFIAGFSIAEFLMPNHIIDGGIIGIAMMLNSVTKLNLGLLVVGLNLPFIFLALHRMGKWFILYALYSVLMLGLSVNIFYGHLVTAQPLLAAVFGGIILGLGVGIILRNNAALDGTEILAVSFAKHFGVSVGEMIMFFNVFIYLAAGFLHGWDSAMYSILTYFVTYRVIDIVLEGFNSSRSAIIISDSAKAIGDRMIKELDLNVTYQKGVGGYTGQEKTLVYCVVSRLDITHMKKLVREVAPTAFIVISEVHEVEGVRVKKK